MAVELAPSKSLHEIERKFLISKLPDDLEERPSRSIDQGYLAAGRGDAQVRLRKANGCYCLTIKRGEGVSREEREIELTAEQFGELWPATAGRRLTKTRYDVPFGQYTIEIDVYHGANEGLVVAEVEFESEKECETFAPPDWLGAEVSGDSRYSNVKLARE